MKLKRTLRAGVAALAAAVMVLAMSACVEVVNGPGEYDPTLKPVIYYVDAHHRLFVQRETTDVNIETSKDVVKVYVIFNTEYDYYFPGRTTVMAELVAVEGDRALFRAYIWPHKTDELFVSATNEGGYNKSYTTYARVLPQ